VLGQLAYFVFKFPVVIAAIRKEPRSGLSEIRAPSFAEQLRGICGADSCARTMTIRSPAASISSASTAAPPARSSRPGRQDSFRAALNHVFERLAQIGGFIETPGDTSSAAVGQLNELPRSRDINAMVFRQNAQYRPIHS